MFLVSCAKDLSFALPFSDFRGDGRIMVGLCWVVDDKKGKYAATEV